VVAYALAGNLNVDLQSEPLGVDASGEPVMLRDLWPDADSVDEIVQRYVTREAFERSYAGINDGSPEWAALSVGSGVTFDWDADSTYLRRPPYFEQMRTTPEPPTDITGARVLVMAGDSVTTDHISPVSVIGTETPAGRYLREKGVAPRDFNNYMTRRANHEVMIRGTFANIRFRNELVPGTEGGVTRHMPSGEQMTVFDAASRYATEQVPLVVVAGKAYGTGSSRDWAAKGTALLGVRAVLAESLERIHRSNLVGMGVLPLQFEPGVTRKTLGLDGSERFDILGINQGLKPGMKLRCRIERENGENETIEVLCRLDTALEVDYYLQGGMLHLALRRALAGD
ncbi:MAG: aconitate hydratase, partial [Gammaproteobacteria bacterium]|nr:aconitate hydratase [Gammaproteobacteria bacterium]